jgi:hypothetical protein
MIVSGAGAGATEIVSCIDVDIESENIINRYKTV